MHVAGHGAFVPAILCLVLYVLLSEVMAQQQAPVPGPKLTAETLLAAAASESCSRAHDPKLHRTVAVKVSAPQFAANFRIPSLDVHPWQRRGSYA